LLYQISPLRKETGPGFREFQKRNNWHWMRAMMSWTV
jgi:hypothetical protein